MRCSARAGASSDGRAAKQRRRLQPDRPLYLARQASGLSLRLDPQHQRAGEPQPLHAPPAHDASRCVTGRHAHPCNVAPRLAVDHMLCYARSRSARVSTSTTSRRTSAATPPSSRRCCAAVRSHSVAWHTAAMPCRAMLCHMPCHAMPCHAMPCHPMPSHPMPCHAMPCHAMPCYAQATEILTALKKLGEPLSGAEDAFLAQHQTALLGESTSPPTGVASS